MSRCATCKFSTFTKEGPALFDVLSGKVGLVCSLGEEFEDCESYEVMDDFPEELREDK